MSLDLHGPKSNGEYIDNILSALPPLSPVVCYFDDYEDLERIIDDYAERSSFRIECDGKSRHFDLLHFGTCMPIVKLIISDWFERFDVTTVYIYVGTILRLCRQHGSDWLEKIISLPVHRARMYWEFDLRPSTEAVEGSAVRAMLHSMCNLSIGAWSPLYRDIVRALPGHPVDKYRKIRAGDCFLPLSHQARVIEYFDDARSVGEALRIFRRL